MLQFFALMLILYIEGRNVRMIEIVLDLVMSPSTIKGNFHHRKVNHFYT